MNPAELFRQAADAFQLAPGDFLFREGDKRDKMYVLLEGEMDIRLGDYVFETAGAGALIGVIAFFVVLSLALVRLLRRHRRRPPRTPRRAAPSPATRACTCS